MSQLGPYTLVRELGRGGMGVVYEARHPQLPRSVALKQIHASAVDGEALERFAREAEAMARVRHPHVVVVHELGRSAQGPYIVTELVEGEELSKLARLGPLEPERVARLLADLAGALQALHEAQIVHRDLKPDNVIVRPDGSPVLLDFGIVRDESAEELTRTGDLLGTPAYMSPEQAGAERGAVGPATDVYGLGAILYELLCGRPPFSGAPLAVLTQVFEVDPPWPRSLGLATPIALEAICRKAMQKDPAQRYESAAALEADLERFLSGDATQAEQERPRSRRPWLAAALVVLALGAAIALGVRAPEDLASASASPSASATPTLAEPTSSDASADLSAALEHLQDVDAGAFPRAFEEARASFTSRSAQDQLEALRFARRELDPLIAQWKLGWESKAAAQAARDLAEAWISTHGAAFPRLRARLSRLLWQRRLQHALEQPAAFEKAHESGDGQLRLWRGEGFLSYPSLAKGEEGVQLWSTDGPPDQAWTSVTAARKDFRIRALAVHPTGKIVVGGPKVRLLVFDPRTPAAKPLGVKIQTQSFVTALACSEDWIAVGLKNGDVLLYPWPAGRKNPELARAWPGAHRRQVDALAFVGPPSALQLVSGGADERLCAWSVSTGESLREDSGRGRVFRIEPDPLNSRRFWTATHRLYQLSLEELGRTAPLRVFTSPDGENVTFRYGEQNAPSTTHPAAFRLPPRALCFSPDGALVFAVASGRGDEVGGERSELRVWERSSGDLIALVEELGVRMRDLVMSPQGNLVALSSEPTRPDRGRIRRWRLGPLLGERPTSQR